MTQSPAGSKKKDGPVYSIVRQSRCYQCDTKLEPGSIVKLEPGKDEREVLCKRCSGLEGMEFLRSGNTKITQLAKKFSTRSFVVMRWSELWKCYERQGLLVEPQAIDKAEQESGIKMLNRGG